MKLSDQLITQNRYDEAIKVLDLTFEEMPVENEQVAADDICYYLCSNYFEAGDTTRGNQIGKREKNRIKKIYKRRASSSEKRTSRKTKIIL